MQVSLKWLKEYVNLDGIDFKELAEKCTVAGIEIEAIEAMSSGNHLVIGYVEDCYDHPQSDHLHVCKVNIGTSVDQIVCGAPNVKKGQKVIVAKPGAILPAKGITIQKSVIRGVESNGMICSLLELGVQEKYLSEESKTGIEVLPEDAPIGNENPLGYLKLDDVTFTLKLTPDRGDCLSLYSFAKEVGALLRREVKPLVVEPLQEVPSEYTCDSETSSCNLFAIKAVHDIIIQPSPLFIQRYLMASGIRSINNVVDIGNYVMLLTGQPLHMYDIDKLESKSFVVKADVQTSLRALDDKEYAIEPGDIVITNGGEIGCLGGVMGAYQTMIDEQTQNVAVEAASFDGATIRLTSKRLQLSSDSSTRFVRGIDLNRCELALQLAANLLIKYAGAKVIEKTVSYDVVDHTLTVIPVSLQRINSLLGTSFIVKDVEEVFQALDFAYQVKGEEFVVTVPKYRNDITIDRDLIEEIIRIKGFECLPYTLPLQNTLGLRTKRQQQRKLFASHLVASGLNEVMSYTLEDKNYEGDFDLLAKGESINILHPLSEDHRQIRKSLLPSLLRTVQYNQARNLKDINVFELSNIYTNGHESEHLGIVLTGYLHGSRLYKSRVSDFYTIKGLIESLLTLLGILPSRYQLERVEEGNPYFHSGRSVYLKIGSTKAGVFGQIHPNMETKYDVAGAYVAELDLDVLFQVKTNATKFTPIWSYPPVTRDIAIVVKEQVEIAQVLRLIKKAGRSLITNMEVFDVYQGEHIEKGYKSLAISLTYQDPKKTLTDKDVNEVQQAVMDLLAKELQATLRS